MNRIEERHGVLAEAAAELSHQLVEQLGRLAEILSPWADRIDRRFRSALADLGHDRNQTESLEAITPGAAGSVLAGGEPLSAFLERVRYRGRRLAKLGLTPTAVVRALQAYDVLLNEEVARHCPREADAVRWVLGQLHFLVILSLNNAFYQVREAESQAFYELFRVEVESGTAAELLPRFLDVLIRYTGADAGVIYTQPEPGMWRMMAAAGGKCSDAAFSLSAGKARRLSKPLCMDTPDGLGKAAVDDRWKSTYRTCWSVPMLTGGVLQGVVQFAFRKSYAWLPREIELLKAAAERCWRAAEKALLLEELAEREAQIRRLAEHMVEVEESERRRISRELHDEAGQSLLCVRLQLERLEAELPNEPEQWRRRTSEARELTEHTILEVRRLIAALSPAILEQMGLAAALRQLAGRFRQFHPAAVKMALPHRLELPKKVEIIVYRLLQEIFNNIAKYSLASTVNLCVESVDGVLRMMVEDNGVGFNVEEALSRRECFGLSGLAERVRLLGGKLNLASLPRNGSESSCVKGGATEAKGRIGVDRCGTSIRIELPVARQGQGPVDRATGQHAMLNGSRARRP